MQSTLLHTLFAATLASPAAFAQSTPSPVPDKPAEEGRGKRLSKFEERFRTADKDGDGALTRAEAEAGNMGRIVEHFDRIDGNKDGKVTREELRSLIRSRLST